MHRACEARRYHDGMAKPCSRSQLRVAADVRLEMGLHTLLRVGIAALLFHVERD